MDYFGYKCPVCNEYFHSGDDIVVCPDCGTPYHRECYNKNGQCINADKHAQGYDFSEEVKKTDDTEDGFVLCKKCGAKNNDDAFFCCKCSSPLYDNQTEQNNPYQTYQNGPQPFNTQGQSVMFIDPLGGVKPDTDIGDGVTAGECAKFVKQSTQYFTIVFNSIKKFSKSRYNFCAFIFGGGYLLYRKMYKLGTILTSIQAIVMVLRMYLSYYITYAGAYTKLMDAVNAGDYASVVHHFYNLPSYDMAMISIYSVLSVFALIFSVVIGACANRMYYKHCKKQIKKIKSDNISSDEIEKQFIKKGGVNIALAMSLLGCELILSYIPYMFI